MGAGVTLVKFAADAILVPHDALVWSLVYHRLILTAVKGLGGLFALLAGCGDPDHGCDRQSLFVKYGERPGLPNWSSPSGAGTLPSTGVRLRT